MNAAGKPAAKQLMHRWMQTFTNVLEDFPQRTPAPFSKSL